jgi:hypothetical protein
VIKIRVKHEYGIQTRISIKSKNGDEFKSEEIGSNSVVVGKLKGKGQYDIKIDYSNSIVELSDFFQCPSLNIEISYISQSDFTNFLSSLPCSNDQS